MPDADAHHFRYEPELCTLAEGQTLADTSTWPSWSSTVTENGVGCEPLTGRKPSERRGASPA